MEIEATVYFFTPLEKDFKDRKELREHLARPTVGRMFLKKNETEQWTVPFSSTSHLMQILNQVHHYVGKPENVDFSVDDNSKPYEKTANIKERRCMRVKIIDVDPETDPAKYWGYAGKGELKKASDFSDKSIGAIIQLDTDIGYKYHKVFFTDSFDAGIKLDKMFAKEVRKRIAVEEELNAGSSV